MHLQTDGKVQDAWLHTCDKSENAIAVINTHIMMLHSVSNFK